ncbi:MAG: HAD-IA family hydrolase [Magnetococcus sp. YQC-9]
MFIFLDIGFTMIGGPEVGPAGWLMRTLDLPAEAKSILKGWLFNTHLTGPESLTERLCAEFGGDPERTRSIVTDFWEQQLNDAYVLPGAREFLEGLQAEGIPYAFISNIWTPFLTSFSRLFPLEFERVPVYASCQLGISKPDAAIFHHALDAVGVWPEQAAMIGDTYAMDIEPAQKLGMKTIWLLHRPDKEREDLVAVLNGEKSRPDRTLATIGALRAEHLRELF